MPETIPQFKVTDPLDDPPRAFVRTQPTISLAPSSGKVQRARVGHRETRGLVREDDFAGTRQATDSFSPASVRVALLSRS